MKKILLAEHDAFMINVYVNQLRKAGYSTSVALDGEIVINRIKSISPDLLILDFGLPKINGLSVLEKVREDAGFKELKVVMLSDFGQESGMENICGVGSVKCFSKVGNTAEEVVEEIKRILS